MHGIFPTHNRYYIVNELFPHLSKKEIQEVYYPSKKPNGKIEAEKPSTNRRRDQEED